MLTTTMQSNIIFFKLTKKAVTATKVLKLDNDVFGDHTPWIITREVATQFLPIVNAKIEGAVSLSKAKMMYAQHLKLEFEAIIKTP